jgi:hypothetical protein
MDHPNWSRIELHAVRELAEMKLGPKITVRLPKPTPYLGEAKTCWPLYPRECMPQTRHCVQKRQVVFGV